MKTAQLIEREEKTLYLDEKGEVVTLTAVEKLAHQILSGRTEKLVTEKGVSRFRGNTQRDLDTQFWNWMATERKENCEYYMIIDNS